MRISTSNNRSYLSTLFKPQCKALKKSLLPDSSARKYNAIHQSLEKLEKPILSEELSSYELKMLKELLYVLFADGYVELDKINDSPFRLDLLAMTIITDMIRHEHNRTNNLKLNCIGHKEIIELNIKKREKLREISKKAVDRNPDNSKVINYATFMDEVKSEKGDKSYNLYAHYFHTNQNNQCPSYKPNVIENAQFEDPLLKKLKGRFFKVFIQSFCENLKVIRQENLWKSFKVNIKPFDSIIELKKSELYQVIDQMLHLDAKDLNLLNRKTKFNYDYHQMLMQQAMLSFYVSLENEPKLQGDYFDDFKKFSKDLLATTHLEELPKDDHKIYSEGTRKLSNREILVIDNFNPDFRHALVYLKRLSKKCDGLAINALYLPSSGTLGKELENKEVIFKVLNEHTIREQHLHVICHSRVLPLIQRVFRSHPYFKEKVSVCALAPPTISHDDNIEYYVAKEDQFSQTLLERDFLKDPTLRDKINYLDGKIDFSKEITMDANNALYQQKIVGEIKKQL